MKSILLLVCLISPSTAGGTQSDCEGKANFPLHMNRTNDGSFSAVMKLKSKSLGWTLDLDVVSSRMNSTKRLATATLDAESRKLSLNCTGSFENKGEQISFNVGYVDLKNITLKFQINGTILEVLYQKSPAAFERIGKMVCPGFGSKENVSLARRGEEISGIKVFIGRVCSSGNEGIKWISSGTIGGVTVLIVATVCLVIASIIETVKLCKEKTTEPNITRPIFDPLPPSSSRQILVPVLGQQPIYRIQEREVTIHTDGSRTESTLSPPETNVQVLYKVRTTVNLPEGVCNSLSSGGQRSPSGSSDGHVHQNIPSTRYGELPQRQESQLPHIYDNLEYL